MRTWQLQAARGRFRQLVDDALAHGPQRVTRRGKPAVVVVSETDWQRMSKNVPSFGKLLAAIPVDDDRPRRGAARVLRPR
jgi:antitoxin Phd